MAQELKPTYTFSEDRLRELKKLFPEAFEDGYINVDTLKEVIGDTSTDGNIKEHYGLNWVGKRDARRIASKSPTGTLKPCFGEGLKEDSTENIFIEGENLEVLKILRKSYSGRIKMIYIDPPYNTGHDFIYKDDFSDSTEDYLRKTGEKGDEGLLVSNPKSQGKFHANWLSFMYPRLQLAKDLLKNDGVIFISIDDNELSNLQLITHEIFGEENFKGIVSRLTGTPTGQGNSKIINELDYILIYTKDPSTELHGLPFNEKDAAIYNQEDENGKYLTRPLRKTGGEDRREDRPSMFFPLISPDNEEVFPIGPTGYESRWRCSKEKYKKCVKDNLIEWKRNRNGDWNPYLKFYLDGRKKQPSNLWSNIEGNKKASIDVKQLFNFKAFDFPKPIELIERCCQISTGKDDIVLDFFAGSGTTAHAVYRLNQKEKTSRKFICVQIPELIDEGHESYKNGFKTIADLCFDRIKKSHEGLSSSDGVIKYKLSKSCVYKWQDFNPEKDGGMMEFSTQLEFAYKNPIEDNTSTEEFLTEILLQEGFPLSANQEPLKGDIIKITSEHVPYTLYVTKIDKLDKSHINSLNLTEEDHFVCLDKAFGSDNSLKQMLDDKCKLFTI